MLERNKPLTKKDTLEFIRAHREALNEKTVKASPQEEGQFLPEMQMWNAIEAQVREMTAVEYLEAREEICNRHYRFGNCAPCPFSGSVCLLWRIEREECSRAVEIVKRWKEEQDEAR